MSSNQYDAELKRRVDRRIDILDQVADLTEELKAFKAEDKSDGFTEAAIADAVKLRRADPDKVLATLMLEAEKTVYRKAAGVPIDIETAQTRARDEAERVPEPKRSRARRGDNDDQVDIEDLTGGGSRKGKRP